VSPRRVRPRSSAAPPNISTPSERLPASFQSLRASLYWRITTRPELQLERLLAVRAKAHRIEAPPLTSVTELEAWIDGRGLVLVSGKSAIGNAAEAIAGRPIDGSWWGDPLGPLIYRLLNELEDEAPQYLDVVLAEGKRTLVSPLLVPVVRAVAGDRERRHRVEETLKEPARKLLEVLAAGRVVRSDDPEHAAKSARSARIALEAGLLAHSTSVHTAAGHHASLLESYAELPPTAAQHGLRELTRAALSGAVVADMREVEKWFRFVEPDRQRRVAAITQLDAREIQGGGRVWLTLDASG
jgi:hypothetical protein